MYRKNRYRPGHLSDLLRSTRRSKAMQQFEIQDALGLNNTQTISNWERGTPVAFKYLPKLSQFLEISMEDLLAAYLLDREEEFRGVFESNN